MASPTGFNPGANVPVQLNEETVAKAVNDFIANVNYCGKNIQHSSSGEFRRKFETSLVLFKQIQTNMNSIPSKDIDNLSRALGEFSNLRAKLKSAGGNAPVPPSSSSAAQVAGAALP